MVSPTHFQICQVKIGQWVAWEEWVRNESGLQKTGCQSEFGKLNYGINYFKKETLNVLIKE